MLNKNYLKLSGLIVSTLAFTHICSGATPVLKLPMDKKNIMTVSHGGTLKQHKSVTGKEIDMAFVAGKKAEGLVIDSEGISSSGFTIKGEALANLKEGTIAFWFQPLASYAKQRYKILTFVAANDKNKKVSVFIDNGTAMMIQSNASGKWASAHFKFSWWEKPTWQAEKWYHIAVTWNADQTVIWYVNGSKISDSIKAKISLDMPIGKIVVGADEAGKQQINAVLDEVVVFDEILPPQEIKELFEMN